MGAPSINAVAEIAAESLRNRYQVPRRYRKFSVSGDQQIFRIVI
jgi:hypothetical protein